MPDARTDLEQMMVQARTLYRLDARGRMLSTNEPDAVLAPRLFLGRTRQGNLWSVRHDLPDDLAAEIDRLCRAEPVVTDLSAPPVGYDALRAVLGEHKPVTEEYHGPCFRFPETLPELPGAVELTENLFDALGGTRAWLSDEPELYAPVAAVLVGGRAVALCFCSRIGDQACEAGLETLAEHRRHGYAAAATALWARLVRARGLTPLYSTEWVNVASRGVARSLGLIEYGEDFSLT